MITIAICDDSILMVNSLKTAVKEYAQERNKAIKTLSFTSGIELLKNYTGNYDIIFLDIKMPDMDGIKVAESIRKKDKTVIIIFLTSLLQHALDGYRVNAANYIIKPIGKKKLYMELDRQIGELAQKQEPFLTFHNDSGNYKILLKSIRYIETYNRNLLIHTDQENYICYWKLKEIESKIKMYGFSRNHSSYLVNLFYVDSLEKTDIKLCTGEIIPLSKTKKKDFMIDLAACWGKSI